MLGVNRIFRSLTMSLAGLIMLWFALNSLNRNHRLDVNPHVQATVERTWTTSGKHASRYADLRFPGTTGLCRVGSVRLGAAGVATHVGQTVDVAPIPGSCDQPDSESARSSGISIGLEIACAFVTFLYGVMALLGLAPLGSDALFAPDRSYG
jgi:hypothetical protein